MNWHLSQLKIFLFILILLGVQQSISQELKDTSFGYTSFFDSIKISFNLQKYQPGFYFLHQSPDEKDKRRLKKYKYLLTQQPTDKNYENYYKLACSLWELNELKDAEQLFLNIINSASQQYSTTYRHSSDVPGDTITNLYGYGSYTSNYKNSAAVYLTKIYIINKQFDKAFLYLEDAVKKYPVTYTCGTGFYAQKNVYDFLYACCYEGLKKYDEVLDLLLPQCLERDDKIIVRVIKEKYKPTEIIKYLSDESVSMQCLFDTLPSNSYQTNYNKDGKVGKTDTLTYYSGSASLSLFGKTVVIPRPQLKDGEKVTKEYFIKAFKLRVRAHHV